MKIDYSNKEERKLWEKRLHVIREIRSFHHLDTQATNLFIPVSNLTVNNWLLSTVGSVLNSFKEKKCFGNFSIESGVYVMANIVPKAIENEYKIADTIHKKYAKYFEENKSNKKIIETYITKEGDNFYYKGKLLEKLGKNTNYYMVFCILFENLPKGGEITYKELGEKIKENDFGKSIHAKNMNKFIQTNLTDRNNGFLHYAGIKNKEDNGTFLITVKRGQSVLFNNAKG